MPSQFFSTLQNSCLDTRGWQRPVALLSGALLAFVGLVPAAFAQDKPSLANSPLRQGDIVLQGAITKGATAIEVQITTGIKTEPVTPARVELDSAKRTFRITLADPLKQGQQVQLQQTVGGKSSTWTDAVEVHAPLALEAPVLTNTPLTSGKTTIEGSGTAGATDIEVQIDDALTPIVPAAVKLVAKKGTFRAQLPQELRIGQRVTVRQIHGAAASPWSSPVQVIEPKCTNDCREDLQATFHVGTVLDTFAGSEVQKFVNPEASGGIQWRGSAGVDFGYRAWSNEEKRFANSMWLYGESDYGARSGQFNCAKNSTFLNCQNLPTPPPTGEEFFFIVRNAATLEGFGGLRWEFLALRPGEKTTSVNLYVKAQAGFITVSLPTTTSATASPSPNSGNFAQSHHFAVGGVVTNGYFRDSYFEVGHGRNDLFRPNSRDRWKIDSFLTFPVKRAVNFYIQLFVDSDLGNASHSVQTYFGFDLNLKDIRGWFLPKDKSEN
jgi:hypothetical protein